MIKLRKELGAGSLGTIITLLVVVFLIYMLVKFFPSTRSSFEFKNAMKREAQFARSRPGYDQELKARLLKKAEELGLPINASNLKVEISHGYVYITATYDIEIKTFFHTFKRHFEQKVEGPVFR
ncbi:MAG: hypothetical protein J7L64_09895 [Acidobacteria bacterium]|nr:hypothetical protein [Acidobacteriota bacterium]